MTDQANPSNEPFTVDTDKLRPAIGALADLASRLKSAGQELDHVSQSYGQPWGNDKAGQKFLDQYKKPHSDLITAALNGGTGLSIASDQVKDMVSVYEQIEQRAAELGQQLGSAMGPGGAQQPFPGSPA